MSVTQPTVLIFMSSPEIFSLVTWPILGVVVRFCMEHVYFKAIALFSDQISWPSFMIYTFFIVIHIRISALSSAVMAGTVSVIDARRAHLYLAGRDHCASG